MATTIARSFLGLVGAAYLGLGIWCAVAPEQTSTAVGFELRPGQGQSEFLTVYGGLEVALGLMFLRPLYKRDELASSLLTCLLIHGCLVVFRTVGFVIYTGFQPTTYGLAGLEWAIFLAAAALSITVKR